jgi:hypothetical protein
MIIESKNAVPLRSEERVAPLITRQIFRFEMLTAVNLDDKPRRMTHEISDVGTYWYLPAERGAM